MLHYFLLLMPLNDKKQVSKKRKFNARYLDNFLLTLTPIKFSRPSITPHGENPIQTISDFAFGDLANKASPTCLTTPKRKNIC